MTATDQKREKRQLRKNRSRSRISGTSARPRLSVFRSLYNTSAQLIDDVAGKTLLAVSTKDLKDKQTKVEAAFMAGKLLAEKAKAKNINAVVFDRGGNRYHGRVKAFAEGAREGGLEF